MLLTVFSAACKLNLCISNLDEKYKTIMFETFLSCSAGDWSWGLTRTRRAFCRWDTSPVLGKQFWLINSYSLAFLFLIVLSKSPVQENIMTDNCKTSLLSPTHCKPVTSLYSARFQQMGYTGIFSKPSKPSPLWHGAGTLILIKFDDYVFLRDGACDYLELKQITPTPLSPPTPRKSYPDWWDA